MGLPIHQVHGDLVGTGIYLERDTPFPWFLLLRKGAVEGFGYGDLKVGNLIRAQIGAAGDLSDESAQN